MMEMGGFPRVVVIDGLVHLAVGGRRVDNRSKTVGRWAIPDVFLSAFSTVHLGSTIATSLMDQLNRFHILLSVLLWSFVQISAYGQFVFWNTYTDHVDQSGTEYPEHAYKSLKHMDLTIEKKGEGAIVVDLTKIWGFSYKDRLFRVVHDGRYWQESKVSVVILDRSAEGAYYYLIGDGLGAVKKDQKVVIETNGALSYGLDGDMLYLPEAAITSKQQAKAETFFTDHPQLGWLQRCVQSKTNKYLKGTIGICIKRKIEYPDSLE